MKGREVTINRAFISALDAQGVLTEKESQALFRQCKGDVFVALRYILKKGTIQKSDLGKLWGDSVNVAYVNLDDVLFQSPVVQKMPETFAKKAGMIPLYQYGDVATVAMADPRNTHLITEAEKVMGIPISPVFAFPEDVQSAIAVQYQSQIRLNKYLEKIPENFLIKDIGDITADALKKIAWEKSIVDFTQALMTLSVRERASAIHIEQRAEDVRVRFRIDGVLQDKLVMKTPYYHPLACRLKLLAKLDSAERHKPMKGRISLDIAEKTTDFMFSSVPTAFGEKLVLRTLNKFEIREIPDLDAIGLSKSDHSALIELIRKPNGLFIVAGPQGSGRMTTLFSMIRQVNNPEINVMAVTDSANARIPGVNQVLSSRGVDHTTTLATVLEQDPDVILMGEIIDKETAEIAVRAALTGCLVFSTIFANSAFEIPFRLMEMGVEAYQTSAALLGGMAQRVLRRTCDYCKEQYQLDTETANRLFIRDENESVFFYRGKGCAECNQTGYRGQVRIYELFRLNQEIRTMIAKSASAFEIEKRVSQNGHRSMRYDGMKKTLRGLTTIEELDRITGADEF